MTRSWPPTAPTSGAIRRRSSGRSRSPSCCGTIRRTPERAFAALCAHNGTPDAGKVPTLLGTPDQVAAAIRPYVGLGFSTVIVRLPAPYDAETIARIGEVRAALAG